MRFFQFRKFKKIRDILNTEEFTIELQDRTSKTVKFADYFVVKMSDEHDSSGDYKCMLCWNNFILDRHVFANLKKSYFNGVNGVLTWNWLMSANSIKYITKCMLASAKQLVARLHNLNSQYEQSRYLFDFKDRLVIRNDKELRVDINPGIYQKYVDTVKENETISDPSYEAYCQYILKHLAKNIDDDKINADQPCYAVRLYPDWYKNVYVPSEDLKLRTSQCKKTIDAILKIKNEKEKKKTTRSK